MFICLICTIVSFFTVPGVYFVHLHSIRYQTARLLDQQLEYGMFFEFESTTQGAKVDDLGNKLLKTCDRQNSRWPPVAHSKYFEKNRAFYAIHHFRLNK